jgi:tetratricopeptide (TPR) repeat protein
MKIYIHYENSTSNEAFTVAQRLQSNETAIDVIKSFLNVLEAKCPGKFIDISSVVIRKDDGYEIRRNEKVSDVCSNGDDVFISFCFQECKRENPDHLIMSNKKGVEVPLQSSNNDFALIERQIHELFNAKMYKKCRIMCDDIISSVDKSNASLLNTALKYRTKIDIYLNRINDALGRLESVYHMTADNPITSLSSEILSLYGECLVRLNRYDEAKSYFRCILNTLNSQTDQLLALNSFRNLAECLFACGRHDEAAELINMSLSISSSEHILTLCSYAHFAFEYNKVEETIQALLKVGLYLLILYSAYCMKNINLGTQFGPKGQSSSRTFRESLGNC